LCCQHLGWLLPSQVSFQEQCPQRPTRRPPHVSCAQPRVSKCRPPFRPPTWVWLTTCTTRVASTYKVCRGSNALAPVSPSVSSAGNDRILALDNAVQHGISCWLDGYAYEFQEISLLACRLAVVKCITSVQAKRRTKLYIDGETILRRALSALSTSVQACPSKQFALHLWSFLQCLFQPVGHIVLVSYNLWAVKRRPRSQVGTALSNEIL
jgi:hypothetical protein